MSLLECDFYTWLMILQSAIDDPVEAVLLMEE
jgi:hypothetical protein